MKRQSSEAAAGENAVSAIIHCVKFFTKETNDVKYSDFLLNNAIYDTHILPDQYR